MLTWWVRVTGWLTAWWRINKRRPGGRGLAILLLIGIASLAVRLLFFTPYSSSALLYLAIPYGLSWLIFLFWPVDPTSTGWRAFLDHVLIALAIMFASSLLLGEGFLCVLFFVPIYLLAVTVGYLSVWIARRRGRRNQHLSLLLPLLMLGGSMEGVFEATSVSRDERVVVSRVVAASAAQLHANLAKPIRFSREPEGLLKLFPMPVAVQSQGLYQGAEHLVRTKYHRWFVTNTHEGEVRIQLTQVSAHKVSAQVISDNSYIANYLGVRQVTVRLQPVSSIGTRISLELEFERRLDPAWYFQPMQTYAVTRFLDYLISEVITRD